MEYDLKQINSLNGIVSAPSVEHGVGIYQYAFERVRVPIGGIKLGLPL
jgi:hypothetical protein